MIQHRTVFWISLFLIVLGVFVLAIGLNPPAQTAPVPESIPDINVYFSPKGGCTDAIINELKQAKESIFVQAYSFTSEPIAQALTDAHKRGVKVEIILDKGQRTAKYTQANVVAQTGIPTYIDRKHAIAHNKIMIIDSKVIITGSFNFSKSAEEKNAENLLIIKDQPELVKQYIDNYAKHKLHSESF